MTDRVAAGDVRPAPDQAGGAAPTLSEVLQRLEELNAIGVALSQERDIERLLERILLAAKAITHADGGTLYRMADDGQTLRFVILRTDSLGMAMGGSASEAVRFPDLPLHDADGNANDSLVAAYAALHVQTVNIADAYAAQTFDFSGTRQFDARTGYRTRSVLAIPLKQANGNVLGVLQLINAQPLGDGTVQSFSQADQSLAESLASQAAIALSNRLLMAQQEALFESFINLINLAIDEKSPYTGGHCQRVPELTMMLVEAAARQTDGPLATFTMDERDRYELRIASLLHDCGKITTPVHVVDKATKLQTLYDRIGLIDTRFEVLKRDTEIEALRSQLDLRPCGNAHAEVKVRESCDEKLAQLDAARAFVRSMNEGRESTPEADIQRMRDIACNYQWRNPEGLPVDFLDTDELENLTVKSGTLTAKERSVINHHIVATIRMLEQLPWPSHLRRVPEFAGGHHERMDGKGYPRGLTREHMSIPARAMGIADIFEALTASDRPYKLGMKLSQAMTILRKFRDNGHIDPDLYDVFVRERLYQRYAEQFLDPWQIDDVEPQA